MRSASRRYFSLRMFRSPRIGPGAIERGLGFDGQLGQVDLLVHGEFDFDRAGFDGGLPRPGERQTEDQRD